MFNASTLSARKGQGGSSPAEVLFTIVIRSIGILGPAGMQTAALRGNHPVALNIDPAVNPHLINDESGALVDPPVDCVPGSRSANTHGTLALESATNKPLVAFPFTAWSA